QIYARHLVKELSQRICSRYFNFFLSKLYQRESATMNRKQMGNLWGLGGVGTSPPEGLGETNQRGDWRVKIDVVLGAKNKHCGAAEQCG
ncbi:hypothetical protein ACOME3_002955, partial [Neoechinorhynchus agilis]